MKWFNNRKVGVKVFLSCLIFMTLIVIISVQGIVTIRGAADDFQHFFKENFIPVRQLNRITADLLQIRTNMLQELMSAEEGDWMEVESRIKNSKELTEAYNKEWDSYKLTKKSKEEEQLVKEWENLVEAPKKLRADFAAAIHRKDWKTAKKDIKDWNNEFEKINIQTRKILNYIQAEAEGIVKHEEIEARNEMIISIVFLAVSILMSIIITLVLSRSVSRPVGLGLAFAERFAKGDLTARMNLDQNDELGQLGKALNTAAENLEELVSGRHPGLPEPGPGGGADIQREPEPLPEDLGAGIGPGGDRLHRGGDHGNNQAERRQRQ